MQEANALITSGSLGESQTCSQAHSRFTRPIIGYTLGVVFVVGLLILQPLVKTAEAHTRNASDSGSEAEAAQSDPEPSLDTEVKEKLLKAARGDSAAAEDLIANAQELRGKIHWKALGGPTNIALNSRNMRARVAAVEISLALNGFDKNESSIGRLRGLLGDPQQRPWALWNLGALGQLGVEPEKVDKIIGAYLSDSDSATRANAVNALEVLATDETIPILLDRFRNDSSPLVQERAACGLAESGLYSRQQRLHAAVEMINFLDDATISAQQRAWLHQALRDISGQQFGDYPAAWRAWHSSAH